MEIPDGEPCTCQPNPRPDVTFLLHTGIPERDLLISTCWLKRSAPDPARLLFGDSPAYARTVALPLRVTGCSLCLRWRWVGAVLNTELEEWPASWRAYRLENPKPGSAYDSVSGTYQAPQRYVVAWYDPARCTEGGLAETHEHFVALARLGLPLVGWSVADPDPLAGLVGILP